MRADDHDIARDDQAERRRERDREREPRPYSSTRLADLARRHKAEAHQLDLINAIADTASLVLECPVCGGPVFAPADSSGESISCANERPAGPCDAQLVTARTDDGAVVAVLAPDGAP